MRPKRDRHVQPALSRQLAELRSKGWITLLLRFASKRVKSKASSCKAIDRPWGESSALLDGETAVNYRVALLNNVSSNLCQSFVHSTRVANYFSLRPLSLDGSFARSLMNRLDQEKMTEPANGGETRAVPHEVSRLFRPQAIKHANRRLQGEVLVPQPRVLFVGVSLALGVLMMLGALLGLAEYSPRESVRGHLEPQGGVTKVFVPRPGVVRELLVTEGDIVQLGQRIAIILIEESMSEGVGLQTKVIDELYALQMRLEAQMQTEQNLKASERRLTETGLRGLREELQALETQESTIRQQLLLASELYERARQLLESGYITASDVAQRRTTMLETRRDLESLQVRAAVVRKSIRETEIVLDQVPDRLAQRMITVESEIAEVSRQILALQTDRSYAVLAPSPGRITALQAQRGRYIGVAHPLLAIVPIEANLEAHLFVPSRSIGFLAVGSEVALRLAAFPYQIHGVHKGIVHSVSETSLLSGEWGAAYAPPHESMYRVIVTLDQQTLGKNGMTLQLQSGMLLTADLLLGKRPLWKHVFASLSPTREQL